MSELGFHHQRETGAQGDLSAQGLTFVRPLPHLVAPGSTTGDGAEGSSARPLSFGLADRLFPARTALDSGVYPPVNGLELGHFQIEERIGRGGMGAVFRAIDKRLDRVVALKVLAPEYASDPDAVLRFQNEARAAARLDHDNIARVYYIGSEGRIHFIAFEFVTGTNIRTLIHQKGRLSPAEAVNYTLQVAEALRQTYAANVVHRDIKPSNIIVSNTGRAKLVDLGLARQIDPEASRDLTVAGTALGTFDYISPEQAMDARNVDVRSDLYSLGCTLYHMLTGGPPYPTGTMFEKVMNHHRPVPPNPADKISGISPELAAIVQKLMASNPDDRYATPDLLIADLIPVAQSLGLEPSPADTVIWTTGIPAPTRPRWQGAPTWGAVAVLLVVLVLADRLRTPQRVPAPDDYRLGQVVDGVPSSGSLPEDIEDLSGAAPFPVPNPEMGLETTENGAAVVGEIAGSGTRTGAAGDSPMAPTANPPVVKMQLAPGDRTWDRSVPTLAPRILPAAEKGAGETNGTVTGTMTTPSPLARSGPPMGQIERGPMTSSTPTASSTPAGESLSRPVTTVSEPFVVIDPATEKRFPCSTLSAACALAKDNWAIEIQPGVGTLIQQEPILLTDKRIRIRPARDEQNGKGIRPLLRFDLSQHQMLGTFNEISEVIRINRGALELYDLDVELLIDPESLSEWTLVALVGGSRLTATGVSVTIVNPFNLPAVFVSIPEVESHALSDLMPERMASRQSQIEMQDCLLRGQFDFLTRYTDDPLSIKLQNTGLAISGHFVLADGSNAIGNPDENRALTLTLDHVTAVTGRELIKSTSGEHGSLPMIRVGIDNGVFRVDSTGLPLIAISGYEEEELLRRSLQVDPSRNRSFFQLTGPFCIMTSSTSILPQGEQELTAEQFEMNMAEVSRDNRIVLKNGVKMNRWHLITPADLDLQSTENNPAVGASGDLQNAGVNWNSSRIPTGFEAVETTSTTVPGTVEEE